MSGDAAGHPAITILNFWADWCGSCRMIAPIVTRVAAGHDDVVLLKVNVEEDAAYAEQMGVQALPTLIFTALDRREIIRLTGPMTGSRIEAALAEARAALG